MKRLSIILLLFLLTFFLIAADAKKKNDPWVSMAEREKIWDEVVAKELNLPLPLPNPKPYTVSQNGLEATFEKDGAKWTIIGANAPIVNPTVYPNDWPVKGDDFEVLVIPEPITNYKILPFTEKIENAVKSDTISITAAKGEYEPASFVIRSGDIDLKDVMIEVTDLKAKVRDKNGKARTAIITKNNIDIRVVKCWYQAGKDLWLGKGVKKLLTPELLVHNDSFIVSDYKYQVNLIKNLEKIEDSPFLISFQINKRENKQIWLTIKVPNEVPQGDYSGNIIVVTRTGNKILSFVISVLPFSLDKPVIEYSMFYLLRTITEKPIKIGSMFKTEDQMLIELKDMKEHGIDNPAIEQRNFDITLTEKILKIRTKAGLKNDPLLYLEWPKLKTDEQSLSALGERVRKIVEFAQKKGINEVYFYAVDELKGDDLVKERPMLKKIRESGAKTFVATTSDFLGRVEDLLDIPIIHETPPLSLVKANKEKGNKMWIYHNPQLGVEEPETYRRNYGLMLLKWGLDGTCNYAYQCDMGPNIWNDFDFHKYRDHVMAYPTINGVVPTIQWEGWREGVDDVRYLSTLMKLKSNYEPQKRALKLNETNMIFLNIGSETNLNLIRAEVIDKLLRELSYNKYF